MKTQNDAEEAWRQEQANYFNAAVGYYELLLLDEAEAELNRIDECVAESVPILALRLGISFCRNNWKEMKEIARRLYLLDPENPKWPFSDGFATAKIESMESC